MTRKQLASAVLCAALATVVHSKIAAAQMRSRIDLGGMPQVAGEAEQYARVLELAGMSRPSSWAIQPFSASQAKAMRPTGDHPWAARFDTTARSHDVQVLRPRLRLYENTAFPFRDAGAHAGGPTWTGRGATVEAQAGVAGFWKNVSFQFAPLAFAAKNTSFDLELNGLEYPRSFADARSPITVDIPQRFGDKPYRRLDLGSSWISVDAFGLSGGFTSAANHWGPAIEFPLVLGPNAGGFPAVYFGTSQPADLWLFKAHMRVIFGQLGRSDYARERERDSLRLGSGAVVAIQPRGFPGLEVGGTRFIHVPWIGRSAISLSTLGRPFSNGLNLNDVATNIQYENQVASVFFRWAFPSVKTEFYGELFRDDFPGKFHRALSLVEKPDDLATYTMGVQNVFRASSDAIRVFRAEVVNGEISHQERTERGFNSPLRPYAHDYMIEGHTLNGLLLGSPDAYGGSGWRLALEEYNRRGRISVALERSLRLDYLQYRPDPTAPVKPDVIYALRMEALRFAGKRDVTLTLIPALDMNRDLAIRKDIFNLYAALTLGGL